MKKITGVILSGIVALGLAGGAGYGVYTAAKADNTKEADVVLFIGQSNMAGRGTASEAQETEEGHAYEFRAISDPSKLYPLKEPFGATENNAESGVTENKKSGSMVSAFCESYYSVTQTPIIAVSCSKGGTGINFWDTNRPAYEDACNRVNLAREYVKNSSEFKLRNTFVVWLQGETDADNYVPAERYTKTLTKIFNGFKEDAYADRCFMIPIGGYNGSNNAIKQNYADMRQTQIDYCNNTDGVTALSIQLNDMSLNGMMTDQFHFQQKAYDIVGADAGANLGYYAVNGKEAECKPYVKVRSTGGAWKAENGRVVIPASAAFENSAYANTTDRYSGSVLYYWKEINGALDGAQCLPDNGSNWNTGTGLDKAPQLHYTFYIETPGTYYLYMLTSHPDTGGNSVLACIDYGTLISCAPASYEAGLWQYDRAWAFEIAEAGEHTITICGREDGSLINQIVLSLNPSEQVVNKKPLEESARLPVEKYGVFKEVNGKVMLDLFSAFEQSDICGYVNRTSSITGSSVDYYWQHGNNGKGIQLMPSGAQWNSGNASDSPYLFYKVDFSEPGDYFVYMHSSFADAASDSAMIGVDGQKPIELAASISSSGNNRWLVAENWKINIPSAGEHVIRIYTRESAATMHHIYLSKTYSDSVGAVTPPESPRIPEDGDIYANNGTYLFKTVSSNDYTLNIKNAGNYSVYAVKNGEWSKLASVAAEAGENRLNIAAANGTEYIYLINSEYEKEGTIKTLVFGDSYTNRTYWQNFDSQMAEIGGETIGISGSTVNNWLGRINDLLLYNPENIVIHIGVNDIMKGDSGETCGNEILDLIGRVRSALPDANIFYVNICNNKSRPEKHAEFAISNNMIKEFADKTDKVYYIDYNTPMQENAANMTNGGFRGDNLHPNEQGYELFSRLIVEAVKSVSGEV